MARILIVDDAANLRLLYRLELEAEGYEIIAVESGVEALEILAREKIDAIVLDLLLPDCFGLELLSEILTWQRHLPLIINTAYEQFRDNFQSWGAEAFIVKSSDLSELKSVLHRIVARRAQNGKQDSRQEKRLQPLLEKRDSNQKSSSSLPTTLALKSHGRARAPA